MPEVFFSLGATELSGEAAKESREAPAQFKYGAELGAPGDEYNKFPCKGGS